MQLTLTEVLDTSEENGAHRLKLDSVRHM